MSLVKEESILSLRMRSVLLRLKSSLSGAENMDDNYKTKISPCEETLKKEKKKNGTYKAYLNFDRITTDCSVSMVDYIILLSDT